MGFRSTYISEDYSIEWPDWFKEKYSTVNGIIYSEVEKKFSDEVVRDTWKTLKEIKWFNNDMDFNIVLLHECGGVTKIQMGEYYLIIADPTDWEVKEEINVDTDWINTQGSHCYCYGCTDLRKYRGIK